MQNLQQMRWEAERVDDELRQVMQAAFQAIQKASDEFDTDLRTAAFVVAIRRVAEAARLRGLH